MTDSKAIPVVPIAQPRSALAQVEQPIRDAGAARPDGLRRTRR
jgi:hypothetical protein